MHITAGVFVNDDESGLHEDIWKWLEGPRSRTGRLRAPPDGGGQRRRPPEVAARPPRGHVPVTKGKLDLGPWQRVFYAEFDGQRPKRLIVKALGL